MSHKKSTKNYTDFLLALALILMPKPIYHGLRYDFFILWNTGYSNFSTYVHGHRCLHVDPGGTLAFPTLVIYKLCGLKENPMLYLHADRFHANYTKNLKKLSEAHLALHFSIKKKIKSKSQNLEFQKKISNEEKIENHQKKHGFKFFKLGPFDFLGHLTKQNMEDIFIRKRKPLAGKYLLLPNHGQPKFLSKQMIGQFKVYKMLISGSQSKKYQPHTITKAKFIKNKIPIVYKNVWGHLIFENVPSSLL